MSANGLPRKAWECKPAERRGKGRPRSTWNDNVMAALEERNIDGRGAWQQTEIDGITLFNLDTEEEEVKFD